MDDKPTKTKLILLNKIRFRNRFLSRLRSREIRKAGDEDGSFRIAF